MIEAILSTLFAVEILEVCIDDGYPSREKYKHFTFVN
jgi:hypothetical protein